MSNAADPAAARVPVPSAQEALRALTDAVQKLSLAEGIEDVQRVVRTAARRLTGADGGDLRPARRRQLLLRRRGRDRAAVEGTALPARVLHQRLDDAQPQARRDRGHLRRRADPARGLPPDLRQEPRRWSRSARWTRSARSAIYWADRHQATEQEIGLARALADSAAVALQNVAVTERFDRAARVNAQLSQEVLRRRASEAGLRELSETDALTGLPNRRQWDRALAARADARRAAGVRRARRPRPLQGLQRPQRPPRGR